MTLHHSLPFLLLLGAFLLQAQSPALVQGAREIAFTARHDGTLQRYLLLLPEEYSASEEHPLLIALHGHGSDRRQFMTPGIPEARASLAAARKHRAIYVSPDYRAPASWMGPAAEADLLQIVAELKRNHRIGRVILSGASMGGTAALTFASLHPDLVDGVVSMNGTANHLEYENFQEAIAASFGGSKQERTEEYKRRSAEYWPERLQMPLALTAGGKDTVVPPDSVVRLAGVLKRLNRPVLLIYRPEGSHATSLEDAEAAFAFVMQAALPRPRPPTAPALPPAGQASPDPAPPPPAGK